MNFFFPYRSIKKTIELHQGNNNKNNKKHNGPHFARIQVNAYRNNFQMPNIN